MRGGEEEDDKERPIWVCYDFLGLGSLGHFLNKGLYNSSALLYSFSLFSFFFYNSLKERDPETQRPSH
jgi:hypothetical protein